MPKRALILGITGQDGSYLADLLLSKGYEVHGMVRRSSTDNKWRIAHVLDQIHLHHGDVTDFASLTDVLLKSKPDEIYNEADQDNVGYSRAVPTQSLNVTFGGVMNLCESIIRSWPESMIRGGSFRIFQPLSATMFGDSPAPQSETSPLNPMSPYAVCKAAAWHLCKYYRSHHGMWISCGILFNHDSERRSEQYLLQKICRSAVRIANGKQDKIALGNLDTAVDVGYAPDFMEAAWLSLQQDKPDDYVIGTGYAPSIRQYVAQALGSACLPNGRVEDYVERDSYFWSPEPMPELRADIAKAKHKLDWNRDTSWQTLVAILVQNAQKEEQ